LVNKIYLPINVVLDGVPVLLFLFFYLKSQSFYILSFFRRLKSKTQVFGREDQSYLPGKVRKNYLKSRGPGI